jgi:hypothetical protein
MPLFARVLMAGLAIFCACMIVRSFRTGLVSYENGTYSLDKQPMTFALMIVMQASVCAFLAWLAAGYDAPSFLRLLGLGWLLPWLG